jgi:hypothetical protein
MLVASGQLDRDRPSGSMAQSAGNSRIRTDGGRGDSSAAFNTAHFTGRSLYLPVLRDALPDELGLFDFPDPQGTIGQRSATNVATQSLHLMNSELVQRQVRSMAERLQKGIPDLRDQLRYAYMLCYSRPASDAEIKGGLQFVQEFEPGDPPEAAPQVAAAPTRRRGGRRGPNAAAPPATAAKPEPPMPLDQAKLAAFCQALMMSAEFRMTH